MGLFLSFFYLSWCTKYYELQCHLVQLRGYSMRYCNANGGKSQRHFVEFRGHGHDKSDPYGCWRSAIMLLMGCHFVGVYVSANTIKLCLHVHLQLAMAQQHTQNAYFRNAKSILLQCKNPLFVRQKPYFCTAKRGFLFFAIMVDGFADAGKRFYFAGVVGCVIVTSMQLFWSSRLRRVVRMSPQVIFSTM